MNERTMRGWKKKVLSLVLAFVLVLEPSLVSMAANEEAATTELLLESVEEELVAEASLESVAEETVTEASEKSVAEEFTGSATEDGADNVVTYSTSTEADFVITDGVLTSYTGTATDVIIPEGVVEIKYSVFERNTTIVSVTFPSSLQIVGNSAFSGCTNLKNVTLNEGLVRIDSNAFVGAGLVGTLTIPGSITNIGGSAFENCEYLEEVVFENGTAETITYGDIGGNYDLFAGCKSLKKATMPNRATIIPSMAFDRCSALTEVYLGNAIQTIEGEAFRNCTALKTVAYPSTLKTIQYGAFSGCTNLKDVVLNAGLTTIGANAFANAGLVGTLTIPGSVTNIGGNAFENCEYLEEVIFENGTAETITYGDASGNYDIFAGCKSLKKVTLPNRATNIPSMAFDRCSALTEVYLGNAIQTIEREAFRNCTALKSIECPSTLKTIGSSAFSGCTNLKDVKLNEGLTTIGSSAFYHAGVSGTLTIPGSVTNIGGSAFEGCEYIEEAVFENGTAETLTYGDASGNYDLFTGCKSLTKVTLPDRATVVPAQAFERCSALTEVYLGNAIQTIEYEAFSGCTALKTLDCPLSLKTIGNGAFKGCTSLKDVKLNEGLTMISMQAFYNAGIGDTINIPTTVHSVEYSAFYNCENLETVVFLNGTNDSLTFVPYMGFASAFLKCRNLKTIYLPERLTALPAYTIDNCTALETLYIPKGVETINDNAISGTVENLTIYGDSGSAAETYANSKGIPFKNKSELGIYAKSIELDRSEITFAGEEAMGRQVTLEATVLPSTAQNKNVVYTSKDEKVATVDANGVVTIMGYGETDIVVASAENSEITASCHVTINRLWNEEELNAIRQFIQSNNNLTLVSNVYPNLQELSITAPEGITATWKLPYEVETGVHLYDVCLNKAGYESAILEGIVVNGVTVTSIEIDGNDVVQLGKSNLVAVNILTEGGTVDGDDYQIEWTSSDTGNVKVAASTSNPLEASVSGVKVSKNTDVIAKLVLKRNGSAVSVDEENKDVTWFEAVMNVTVGDYSVVDAITITATQNQKPVTLEELSGLVNLTEENSYELQASASGYGEIISDVALTWKSSNTSVAKIVADKSGKATLTVLSKGTSVITVTAAKNGGYSVAFRVTVKDSTPRLAEKDVVINSNLINAAGYVTLVPSDGYEISTESLKVVNAKDGSASSFEIKSVDGNTYAIGIKSGENVSKGKYAVKILAKTTAKEETSHELPLTVKVEQKLPKVTLKQSAINLYEKDGRGTVQVISDAEIESIIYTSNTGSGNVRLVQAEVDAKNGVLSVKTENAKVDNYAKAANKGTIKVTFKGYKADAAYEKKITLAVNKKAPAITATPRSATLYPETLADTTEIVLYNKAADEAVLADNGYTVSVNSLNNYVYTSNEGKDFPEIQAMKGAKAGKLTYTITSTNWIDGVKATAKCSFKIGKTPTLSFAEKKITLNTAYTTDVYDAVSVAAYVKGFENLKYNEDKTEIVGKDAKSKDALSSGALTIYLKDGAIKAGVVDSGYFTKAGNYTYIVTAYSESNMPVNGILKVAVVPASKKAALTLKTSGSINLLDRENTSILVTPKLKNYTDTVEKVELYGVNASKFDTQVKNGKIIVKAQNGSTMKINTVYQLGMYVTLDSGVSFQTEIKVKPTQKNPKLVQNVKSVVLFESAKGSEYGEEIAIDVASKQVGEIKKVKLVSTSDTFGYKAGADGTGILYVKDSASLKPGKKYTVKLAVTFEGGASNAKPVYVNVKVDYRK